MDVVWMVIVGLVAGALAKLIMPGRDPGGIVGTLAFGLAGSLLAGWLGRAAGWYRPGERGPGIIASAIGAIVLLFVYRMVLRRRAAHQV